MVTRQEVYTVIDGERDYQDSLRNPDGSGEFLNLRPELSNEVAIFQDLATQAQIALARGKGPFGSGPRNTLKSGETSLDMLRKAVAVGVRALETFGCPPRN